MLLAEYFFTYLIFKHALKQFISTIRVVGGGGGGDKIITFQITITHLKIAHVCESYETPQT